MLRIGVLGAAFNPPTEGHFNLLIQADKYFDLILLVPSVAHAFGKQMLALSHRLAMLELLIKHWRALYHNDKLRVENIEVSLQQQDFALPVYTFDVLMALEQKYQKEYGALNLSFILGPDNAQKEIWQKFYRYQEIEKKWSLFVAKKEVAVSSTQVRHVIATHQGDLASLKQKLDKRVLPEIIEYIWQHHLYGLSA